VTLRRRRPLARKSARRLAQERAEDAVRDEVFRRDGFRCQIQGRDPEHRCWGPLTKHELRKRSQGGSPLDPDNCLTVCWAGNVEIEDRPGWAHALGLVLRREDVGGPPA
jgi:5-methylcytosine-specific restriction endonuclease McrA